MTPGQAAVAAVPRERFVPDTIYLPDPSTGWLVPLHRGDDPGRWYEAVASNDPVVTAVEHDPRVPKHLRDPGTGRGAVSISSSSAPPVVAHVLDVLGLAPGAQVLEIGTGTGWNAALVSHLGGEVTSVEVAPEVAEAARGRLGGRPVAVVIGDGFLGHPQHAPYDRVVATAAVTKIPFAWVDQARPGALIVAPWAPVFHPAAPLAVLTVGTGVAEGRFSGSAPFMPMRGQRLDPGAVEDVRAWWESLGSPEPGRFGVTVDRTGSHVWLDVPGNVVRPPSP
ncbi:protein-L-isoaspartate(D-aspartate) O-methyltransferase [Murinocardiopsis flavida]|uniref:Protein-L-isoaspartate O-methyltransferase n=1 Tax=Murinocardiopsis flavida TaxID=645275 RepID=A0A2P8CVL3_9ACTN|nr:methyltransferase domain-containing protein [Murinocardiopsis flavida]PSK88986.1 protein-L-isoaspartate(D-aspartate) O-methyltransferase [Murinocardiopsis flavida]